MATKSEDKAILAEKFTTLHEQLQNLKGEIPMLFVTGTDAEILALRNSIRNLCDEFSGKDSAAGNIAQAFDSILELAKVGTFGKRELDTVPTVITKRTWTRKAKDDAPSVPSAENEEGPDDEAE